MAVDLSRVNVLVVDDNPNMRNLVRNILSHFGIKNIREADDGEVALDILKTWEADIAIVDWVMEPMDGIEFTKRIRSDGSPNPYLTIIMLTGHTDIAMVLQARDAGVTEFMAKPVTAKGLWGRINVVIEKPRPFVRLDGYLGPDRRRKLSEFSGAGRRASDDKPVGGPTDPNVSKKLAGTAEMLRKLQS